MWDLHFHLPLAACRYGEPCTECDQAAQQLFVDDLVATGGDMEALGVQHVAIQGAANDNTEKIRTGVFDCVFRSTRDAERRAVVAGHPNLSPMLDGFDPEDLNAFQYVKTELNATDSPWKGVGEIHLRSEAYQRTTPANTASMLSVYKEAADANRPVFLHFDTREGATFSQAIAEIRDVLDTTAHPELANLRLVWFHHAHHQCDGPNECTSTKYPSLTCAANGLAPCVEELLIDYPTRLFLGWEFDNLDLFLDPTTGRPGPLYRVLIDYPNQIVIASDVGIRHGLRPSACALDPPYPPGSVRWRFGVELDSELYMEQLICNTRRVLQAVVDDPNGGQTKADAIAFGNAQGLLP